MKRWGVTLAAWIALSIAGTVSAENWHAYRPVRRPIPPREAISQAQRQSEGRVLSTELVRTGEGQGYYRIKMISKGRIQVITVDAYPGH